MVQVEYPANRHQLAAGPQDNDAPIDFVKVLLGLGSVEFSAPEEVIEELERLRDRGQNRPRLATSLLTTSLLAND